MRALPCLHGMAWRLTPGRKCRRLRPWASCAGPGALPGASWTVVSTLCPPLGLLPGGAACRAGESPGRAVTASLPCLPLRSWSSGGKPRQCRYTTDSRRTVPSGRPGRCWIGVSGTPGSWGQGVKDPGLSHHAVCLPGVFVSSSCLLVSCC